MGATLRHSFNNIYMIYPSTYHREVWWLITSQTHYGSSPRVCSWSICIPLKSFIQWSDVKDSPTPAMLMTHNPTSLPSFTSWSLRVYLTTFMTPLPERGVVIWNSAVTKQSTSTFRRRTSLHTWQRISVRFKKVSTTSHQILHLQDLTGILIESGLQKCYVVSIRNMYK